MKDRICFVLNLFFNMFGFIVMTRSDFNAMMTTAKKLVLKDIDEHMSNFLYNTTDSKDKLN